MNRSLVWLILALSVAFHAAGFVFFQSWPVGHASTTTQPVPSTPATPPTFVATTEGFQVGTATVNPPDPVLATASPSEPAPFTVAATATGSDLTLKTRINSLHSNSSIPQSAEIIPARHTVVFMLDKSGSMYESVGNVRRVELATQELRKLITQLDSRTKFNIVLYAEKIVTFQSDAIPASSEAKMLAMRFLQSDIACGGSTDFPAGYQVALAQKADTILLLTDGEFNAQDQQLLTQARNLRLKYNASAQLNVLGFFVRPNTNAGKLLSKLCTDNHGELQFWKLNANRFASLQ